MVELQPERDNLRLKNVWPGDLSCFVTCSQVTNLWNEIMTIYAVTPAGALRSTNHTSTCVQESAWDQAQGIFCEVLYSETALFQQLITTCCVVWNSRLLIHVLVSWTYLSLKYIPSQVIFIVWCFISSSLSSLGLVAENSNKRMCIYNLKPGFLDFEFCRFMQEHHPFPNFWTAKFQRLLRFQGTQEK